MSLFVRHGYRLTSMEMVGQEAGLTRQALYHHFKTKEDLFHAVAGSVQEGAHQSACLAGREQQASGAGLADILIAQITAPWRYFDERTQGSPYAEELMSEHKRQSADLHRLYVDKEHCLIRDTIDRFLEGDGELVADMTSADLARSIQLAAHGAKAEMTGEDGLATLQRTIMLLVRGAMAPAADGTDPTNKEAET